MRSSRATWILVALSATALCFETGCMGSRIGRGIASVPRPRLMGRWRGEGDTEVADTRPKPPASSVPPTGLANDGAAARSFPSEPAPDSSGAPATYASTGAGSGDGYLATSASNGDYESTGAAQPQQGFYGTEPAGGRYADTSARGGASYESTAPRGYDDGSYSGSPREYNQPYAGSGDRGYQAVADARGDYNFEQQSFGGDYNAQASDNSGGPSRYDSPGADSHYVSPQGGGDYDYQSPAGNNYGSDYDTGSSGGGDGYSRFSGGGVASGESYDAPAYGGSQPASSGGYNSTPTGGSTSPASFLPGSTKPYNPQPLTPPTDGNYGSGTRNW